MTETEVPIASPNTAIGIDLGTSFCRVALWQNGKVTVIANKLGNKMTPSYVGFDDTRRFVGEPAKNQRFLNNKNTVRAIKRLLGVGFSYEKIQETLKLQSLQVQEHENRLKCNVVFKNAAKLFSPEEIVAMLLMEMKEIAETHLGGTKVKDAVISVPSYFNQFQRQATMNAAAIAGLNVLRLINDPTAAALAYELKKDFIDVETTKKVMFYCFGGGSLSVSIVEIKNGSSFQVLSTAGEAHLGGEDFDNKLVTYCADKFKRENMVDLTLKATLRLKAACEKAKMNISFSTETTIAVDSLHDEIDFVVEITRARFENLFADMFRSAMKPVEKALKAAKLKTSEINDVVLVGGSTRIPKIQKLLQDYFDGKELTLSVNLEDSVVYGAALQAAVLAGTKNAAVPKVEVVDVTPFSFFYPISGEVKINESSGKVSSALSQNLNTAIDSQKTINFKIAQASSSKINESNCKIPFLVLSRQFYTVKDNQKEITVDISEASTQSKIGSVRFTVPPAPAMASTVFCDFNIDASGILRVFRKLDGGSTQEVIIGKTGFQLSKEEILRMTSDAAKYKQEEDQQRKLALVRNQLEDCISNLKHALEEALKKTTSRYDQVISLIDSHQLTNEAQVASELQEIRNDLNPLVTRSSHILRLQHPIVRAENENQPDDSTRENGKPAAKKARPT